MKTKRKPARKTKSKPHYRITKAELNKALRQVTKAVVKMDGRVFGTVDTSRRFTPPTAPARPSRAFFTGRVLRDGPVTGAGYPIDEAILNAWRAAS